MVVASPVAPGSPTAHVSSHDPGICSDGRFASRSVDNYFCTSSGLVFNATGARQSADQFFQDEYDLHSESAESEFVHFDQGQPIGLYHNIVTFLDGATTLARRGRVLDIGCGKGLLLRRFTDRHPEWTLHAIEPSKNARSFFARNMPRLSLFEGPFEASPFVAETFDLVMANGVLEHVPDPLAFLGLVRRCVGAGGLAFIGVPNFAMNPADLMTYDHLSRFTPVVLRALFERAGLEVVAEAVYATKIPMWFVLRRMDPRDGAPLSAEDLARERGRADRARAYVEASFRLAEEALAASRRDGTGLAFFGTGMIGFTATQHGRLQLADVACAFEDNASLWGTVRQGLPVKPSSELAKGDVGHVIVSANPCYLPTIERRIRELAGDRVKIYAASYEP